MKRIFVFFATMCCMMVTNAQQFTDANGIKYNVTSTEDKTVEVIANDDTEYSGDINIPSTVTYENTEYEVTSIGEGAFSPSSVVSVTIPSTVKIIETRAFEVCRTLSSVSIPEGVQEIGSFNFIGTVLASIHIPSSVTSIEFPAFAENLYVGSIVVADGNPVYDSRNNCNAIIETATNTLIAGCTNTIIPSSVTSIGKGAFAMCVTLGVITIPSSVTSIGDYAFANCATLGVITIPSSVTSIGDHAFANCESLISINIPSGVTSIGKEAFSMCKKLKSITILASTPPDLGDDAFYNVPKDISVYVPDVAKYEEAAWGGFTNFVALDIAEMKQRIIAEIQVAKAGISLSAEEQTVYDNNLAIINDVTESTENAISIISVAKEEALAVIQTAKERIAEIEAKKSILGTMATPQNGPAIIVTDQDGKEIILYSPKKVQYIKVND